MFYQLHAQCYHTLMALSIQKCLKRVAVSYKTRFPVPLLLISSSCNILLKKMIQNQDKAIEIWERNQTPTIFQTSHKMTTNLGR